MDRLENQFSLKVLYLLYLNLFVQSAIIVTGAIVRITKSGLGCPTWPQCVGDSIIPLSTQAESWHKYVEFGNRLLTFVLLIVAILVAVSVWRKKNLKSLRFLSIVPLVGTIAQALLGGVTVLTGLHPTTVAAHFLVSILIVALSHTLVRRYKTLNQHSQTNTLANLLTLIAFIVVFLGTLVTGSGPHSGDKYASSRFSFDITQISSIHAKSVWVFIAVFIWLYAKSRPIKHPKLTSSFVLLLSIVLAQGFLGYFQFAQGVPEILVFIHILGAIGFWIATLKLRYDLMQYQRI